MLVVRERGNTMPEGKPAKLPPEQITLQCGHDATYLAPQPKAGETVYCRRCREYVNVRSNEDEVWARCRDCRVARRHGQDVAGAMRTASKHALTHAGHRVRVLQGRKVLQEVATNGDELPYEKIISDRRELSQRMQQMLKPK